MGGKNGPVHHLVRDGEAVPGVVPAQHASVSSAADARRLGALGALSWEQQMEEVRRGASILLARAMRRIESGDEDVEAAATLKRVFDMAKAAVAKAPADLSDVPDEVLERLEKGTR